MPMTGPDKRAPTANKDATHDPASSPISPMFSSQVALQFTKAGRAGEDQERPWPREKAPMVAER